MFVVETDSVGWRLYTTALPTGRRDGANPPRHIRASILLEGAPEEAGSLANVLSRRLTEKLSDDLQNVMPESAVERWLTGDPMTNDEFVSLSQVFLNQPILSHLENGIPAWCCGSAADQKHQRLLVAAAYRAAKRGDSGLFCWLNLLAEAATLREIPTVEERTHLFVLMDDSTPGNLEDISPSKSPPQDPTRAGGHNKALPTGPSVSPNRAISIILMVVVVAIIAIGAISSAEWGLRFRSAQPDAEVDTKNQ